MEKLPFYIITSDATSDILPATCYLYNKYWQPEGGQEFKILGNHRPSAQLPGNFEFVRIKEENNIQKWTHYVYDYIEKNEQAKYFLVTLDDYMPNAPLKPEIISQLLYFASRHEKVGRISLGRLDVEKWEVAEKCDGYNIVRLKDNSPYRLSCQTSIWNREYFLKQFKNEWTPWQLELLGSELAQGDGWEVIGTDGDWAFGWVEESALSGRWPGMVNILGMQLADVQYCIEQKLFDPKKLQYGIWYDTRIPFLSKFQSISKKLTKIPKFSEVGYGFSWDLVKPYVRGKTLRRLLKRYGNIYPDEGAGSQKK